MDIINSAPSIFQKVHLEALITNSRSISKWTEYKKENEEVQERLKLFLKDLRVPVMIPIGNKAMFRGQLVHTNDILISLGDGYFIKGSVEQATQISQRRIKRCNDMLIELDKEKKLLESRIVGSIHPDVFAGEGLADITEPYDENEDKKWRKEHQEKLQEERNSSKAETTEISDEDLLRRLDYLEMQEELEDELNRLGVEDYSDGLSYSEDEDYESESEESVDETDEIKTVTVSKNKEESIMISRESPPDHNVKRKSSRVTFADPVITESIAEENDSEDPDPENLDLPQAIAISEDIIENSVKQAEANDRNSTLVNTSRPLSKFKAARQKK